MDTTETEVMFGELQMRAFWRACGALAEAARAGVFEGEDVSAELDELAAIGLHTVNPRLREAALRRLAEHPSPEAGALLDYATAQHCCL